MNVFDVLLSGGWIVDGSGAPAWRADLATRGDRIAAIGRLAGTQARTVLDVRDRYLFPGLVDAHVHADVLYTERDFQEAALRQGVTTLIVGQDGLSCAPAGERTAAYVADYFGAVNGYAKTSVSTGLSVREALSRVDHESGLNMAWLVPAGNVRHEVMGLEDRPPTTSELAAMKAIVAQAMDEGAVGLSTGLDYIPGRYATAEEISALCEPVVQAGGIYVTHMRGYEADAWRGMDEVVAIGRMAGVAVHVSHYHGPGTMLRKLIDDARACGIDATFDTYPYEKGSSILAMAALPADVQRGGTQATVSRLRDRTVRDELVSKWFPSISDQLDRITISFVGDDSFKWSEGLSLTECAARAGCPVGDFVCDVIATSNLAVGCIMGRPPTNLEDDNRALLRHEAHMGSSDGVYLGSHPHPRGWGAFARFLGRHVRELGDWTWGEASLHLAGHPARRFGLAGRGALREGAIADIAVVDPAVVADTSSYSDPRRAAVGVSDVLVAGEFAVRDGELTGQTAGRGLRRGEGGQ